MLALMLMLDTQKTHTMAMSFGTCRGNLTGDTHANMCNTNELVL